MILVVATMADWFIKTFRSSQSCISPHFGMRPSRWQLYKTSRPHRREALSTEKKVIRFLEVHHKDSSENITKILQTAFYGFSWKIVTSSFILYQQGVGHIARNLTVKKQGSPIRVLKDANASALHIPFARCNTSIWKIIFSPSFGRSNYEVPDGQIWIMFILLELSV